MCRSVPLRSKADCPESSAEWYIDLDELEAAFRDRVRLIVFNSPHNPTGKVFSRTEYEGMRHVLQASLCIGIWYSFLL